MIANWNPLQEELALWRAEDRRPTFWWRDDDAVTQTAALDRLIDVATAYDVPAHLAVIPKRADPDFATMCARHPCLVPMVHGWAHVNHAPAGAKKAEFGHPRDGLLDDATQALAQMQSLFGTALLPIFVPPWNRIDDVLTAALRQMGYLGVSTFTPRQARNPCVGLVQINTHIDPIHWRGDRSLVPAQTLIDQTTALLHERRHGAIDPSEPLGLLTHHLDHDTPIWQFTETLLSNLLKGGAKPLNLLNLKDNLP